MSSYGGKDLWHGIVYIIRVLIALRLSIATYGGSKLEIIRNRIVLMQFLSERDYVTFGSLLSQIR